VLTVEPRLGEGLLGILRNADVRFADTIIEVGRGLDGGKDTIIVDGHGKIVLPGFVDTHNHLWQSLIRGCGPDLAVDSWIVKCVIEKFYFDEDQAYWGTRLSTVDLIGTGVTTVLDWSHSFSNGFTEGNLRALRDSNLRFIYGFMLAGYRSDEEADLRKKKSFYIDRNPLAGLHVCTPLRPVGTDDLEKFVGIAKELGVPLNVHILEGVADSDPDPIEVLRNAHAFDGLTFFNHAVRASDQQIQFLADHRVPISHNPLSNLRLASGVIPLGKFAEQKLRVGLGLDGGSNDTSDVFANMRVAVGLQRARAGDAAVFPSVEQVIRMATLGGAEALGMEQRIGSLSPGKRADMILLDPARANFAPMQDDGVAQIVFNGQPGNVEAVFVDGRPLKWKGRVVLDDTTEEEIVAKAQKQAERPPPSPSAQDRETRQKLLKAFNLTM
jgi:5-methylthioadenosine/S-adenosylhomocysteine deaminase